MSLPSVELWFEFASTYSYLAVQRAGDVMAAHGLRLEWKPFLLGPIFRSQGWNDSPFNVYPVKGRYMWRDLERLCARYGLPWRKPSQFPRSGLLAARVACASAAEPWCPAFVRAVFRANFVEDRDTAAPDTIVAILDSLALPARDIVARAESAETRERLRLQTERAERLGIFGAPTFVVGNELFWGHDRLDDAIGWATERGAGRSPG